MTLPRPIICSILSALWISACSILGPDIPRRVVRVKVVADVPFRSRNPDWEKEARGLLEAASDYYEREFEIRFVAQSVSAWPISERVDSTPALLAKLKKEFPVNARHGSYDLLVAFSGESASIYLSTGRARVDRIGNCQQGLASFAIVPIHKVFHYQGTDAEPELDVVALIHELAHVFGAEHVEDINSIMNENFGYRTEFDAKNRSVILNNRACPFAK